MGLERNGGAEGIVALVDIRGRELLTIDPPLSNDYAYIKCYVGVL